LIREGVIFAFGYFTVNAGREEQFLEKWQQFAQWTLNHAKGARWMYIVRDNDDPRLFVAFGPWESQESIAEWRQSSKSRAAFAELSALCDRIEEGTMTEVNHVKR